MKISFSLPSWHYFLSTSFPGCNAWYFVSLDQKSNRFSSLLILELAKDLFKFVQINLAIFVDVYELHQLVNLRHWKLWIHSMHNSSNIFHTQISRIVLVGVMEGGNNLSIHEKREITLELCNMRRLSSFLTLFPATHIIVT